MAEKNTKEKDREGKERDEAKEGRPSKPGDEAGVKGKARAGQSAGEADDEGEEDEPKESRPTKTYICITCDKTFEVEQGEKPRCPRCMSIHSVEPYLRRGMRLSKQQLRLGGILLVLVVVAVGAYFVLDFSYKKGPTDLAAKVALTHEELVKLLKDRGIGAEDAVDPFASKPAFESFVKSTATGISSKGKAQKLYDAFMAMKKKGGFAAYIPRQPNPAEPKTAGQAFEAARKNEETPLTSLELALMFTKAARIAGLDAAVARVDDYKGLKAPLDPSGNVGHYAAAVYDDDSFQGEATLYDLHQGKVIPHAAALFTLLKDVQATAAFLGHEAFYLSGIRFDSTKALAKVEDAMSLYPASPELHSLKGLIYIASGGIEEGKQQIRKALTIRKDAQRVLKWGAILMAEGEEEAAIEEIRKAIDMKPEYAMAHATLAMALLSMGESDEARQELDLAKQIDPADPLIPLYEANYYIERGQVGTAIDYAEKAFDKSYGDPQVGMLLAALYEQTGERSRMAKVLDKLLENENLSDELKATIKDRFGYVPTGGGEEDEEDEELEEEGLTLDLGDGIGKKGGGLLSGQEGGLGKKGMGSLDEEDEEDEEVGDEQFKLKMGGKQGGLLTGKGSGLDLQIH